MDTLLYLIARALIGLLQAMPLRGVARLGRMVGGLVYLIDGRHRRVAINNLARCFPEMPSVAIREIAKENFRRIGENFACAVKTAAMTAEELRPHIEFIVPPEFQPPEGVIPPSVVGAIGHFGNFELYARFNMVCRGYQGATTYRGLRQPSLNKLLQSMRATSKCLFFERRFDADKLKAAMNQPGIMLGLLSDQSAGQHGMQLPFFGHNASTSPAAALFALRYKCPLYTAICYRVGLAKWRVEAGAQIPTHENGEPRSTAAIMSDVNTAFEAAVRRDPANWFWVHNRWKRGIEKAKDIAGEELKVETPAA